MRVFLVKVVNCSIYRIRKMLISCIKLDHVLYSINYGMENVTNLIYFADLVERLVP